MNENEKMLIFERGVKMGIQMMMNKIESNCEKGKPVSCNGNLYWLTDSREHLFEVMDSYGK